MRCLNMKIGNVLFFIANFIVIYSKNLSQDKTYQTLLDEESFENKFDKDCPHLSNIIRKNNLTDYTVNCRTLNPNDVLINEENVLHYSCFIVKNILTFMCENKLNVTSDFFKQNNVSSLCPFNFSHLGKLGFKFNNKLINELRKPDHCVAVCKDLYSFKTQCVVLNKFNNYLMHVVLQQDSTAVNVSEPSTKPDHPEVIIQKTEKDVVRTLQDTEQHSEQNGTKEITRKEKTETTNKSTSSINNTNKVKNEGENINKVMNENKETEKPMISTPKDETKSNKKIEIPENEIKISEDEKFLENNESRQKNEDLNEEEEDIINDDDIGSTGSISEPFPVKTDFNQVQKFSKMESSEVKMDSFSKGKEIYTGEGFFQAEDSHFFFYFIMVSSIIVVGYLAFHNKNKILAYALEGTNGRHSRRRPNPARYRKLETNLEEVISSNATNAASSSVVY